MKPLHAAMLLVATLAPAPAAIRAQQIPTAKDIETAEMNLLFIQEIKLWKALQSHDLFTFSSLLLPDSSHRYWLPNVCDRFVVSNA